MSDPNVVAAYRRAFVRCGVPVTVTRLNGQSPNIAKFEVEVTAIVRNYTPDTTTVAETGFAASKVGAITQGDRMVILIAEDLAGLNFPLPMKKNDRITVRDPITNATVDVLNVTEVDPLKRAVGAAIELKAAGVA